MSHQTTKDSVYDCAVIYHNYYSLSGVEELRKKIASIPHARILFLCSLPDKFAENMPRQVETEQFIITANKGKDIGGKLLLTALLLQLHPETPYVIFLHDKRSYHKHSGGFEKEKLFNIISPEKFDEISNAFENDPTLGIACAKGTLRNEHDGKNRFTTTNNDLLNELTTKYEITLTDYRFVAGTMFWIKTELLRNFFSKFPPLQIRSTLEDGNVLDNEKGTITHSWERILSWIATANGHKIKEF